MGKRVDEARLRRIELAWLCGTSQRQIAASEGTSPRSVRRALDVISRRRAEETWGVLARSDELRQVTRILQDLRIARAKAEEAAAAGSPVTTLAGAADDAVLRQMKVLPQ
jgi:hypothetical protein